MFVFIFIVLENKSLIFKSCWCTVFSNFFLRNYYTTYFLWKLNLLYNKKRLAALPYSVKVLFKTSLSFLPEKILTWYFFFQINFSTFYYDHQTGCCVTRAKSTHSNQEVNSIVGFKFPGVSIVSNFISSSEEADLVQKIDSYQWKSSQSGRCKQDFGPKVNFKRQKIKFSTFSGLPAYITDITCRMKALSFLTDFQVVEQCNLEYIPERGSQIEPHFDDDWLWGERLVTLNMLSETWLTMSCASAKICKLSSYHTARIDKFTLDKINDSNLTYFNSLTYDSIKVKIPLLRYSLVVLHGPARYEWKHAIERSVPKLNSKE